MVKRRDIDEGAFGGRVTEPYDDSTREGTITDEDEDFDAVEAKGPSAKWEFWHREIQAAFTAEKDFRTEGANAEKMYFGDPKQGGNPDDTTNNKVNVDQSDGVNVIHANIEVLKPLLFSELPEPMVRQKFGGDASPTSDPTNRVAAIIVERLAKSLIESTAFEEAMEAARDDWIVPGRGNARVMYQTDFEKQQVDLGNGVFEEVEKKVNERLKVRHWPWRRVVYAPTDTYDDLRWEAYEIPMTKARVAERFDNCAYQTRQIGEDETVRKVSELASYPYSGLIGMKGVDHDEDFWAPKDAQETSEQASVSSHKQCFIYEIWDKRERKVIWYSPHYTHDVLDVVDDPLNLENFFNSPRPLLATTIGGGIIPRPDVAYYKARSKEIDVATNKMMKLLNTISVSGAYPGALSEEVKKLLKGENILVPITEWTAFMEKGGVKGIIDWLPLEPILKALQALAQMREQAKQQLYEVSGVSDILRGQTDPNETLGAQQIKGNYANIRLRSKQRRMQIFARDTLRLMIEVGLEHFSVETIADMTNYYLPATVAELQQINAQIQQTQMAYQAAMKVAEANQLPPPPPPPAPPVFEQTSWEQVHAVLTNDFKRKFTLSIETDGTILQDAEEDKKQRIEFLSAFSAMAEKLFPLAAQGVIKMSVLKELLKFAVRGFPKSKTLEGFIDQMPDELNNDKGPPPQVLVAQLRAETDKVINAEKLAVEVQEGDKDRKHEISMKGIDLIAESVKPQPEKTNGKKP